MLAPVRYWRKLVGPKLPWFFATADWHVGSGFDFILGSIAATLDAHGVGVVE
jgi:hypothetical protein